MSHTRWHHWRVRLARRSRLLGVFVVVLLIGLGGALVAVASRPGDQEPAVTRRTPGGVQQAPDGPDQAPRPSGEADTGLVPAGSATPAPTAAPGGVNCTVSKLLVPSCGAWLGIWPRTTADGTPTTDLYGNVQSLEGRLGRKFNVISRYYGWTQLPPDGTDTRLRDSGHLILIDLRARNFSANSYVQWKDIAAGAYDPYLNTVAGRMRDFRSRVFFSFNQEPEQELERGTQVAGTAADFAAAYRHIHDVFERAGASNVVWVWWVMGYTGHVGWYPTLYPGDRYVDWISYDPYDFNRCHNTGYETPSQSVLPWLDWLSRSGLGTGKPVMLSEFGSHGTDRGAWYRGIGPVVKQASRIRAVISFNSNPGGCDTRVTASADNWQGFASLAADPYFNINVPSGP